MENYEMNNENYEMNNENVETKNNKVLPAVIGGGVVLLAGTIAWKKLIRPKLVKAAAGILRDAQATIDAEFEESKQNEGSTEGN